MRYRRYTGGQGGHWHQSGGFSLVEVVSSLGIISFGLVALLGLLPVGMQVSREAQESTVESQIKQGLTNLALQTAPDQLATIVEPRTYYFDQQGIPVEEGAATVFYRATLSMDTTAGTALPSDTGYVSGSLSTFRLSLTRVTGKTTTRVSVIHRALAGR